MAVGLLGFLGVGVESSGGTASFSAAIVDFIPFQSEGLQVNRQDLEDPGLWHGFDARKVYNGQQNVTGPVAVVAHPMTLGYLLRPTFDVCTATQAWGGVTSHSGVRGHRFTTAQVQFQAGSGSDTPTMTFEIFRGPIMATAAGSSFMYYNVTANNFELSVEAGQLVRATIDGIGRDYGNKSASSPSYHPAEAFLWNQASVALNGSGTALFQTLTFRVENNIVPIAALDGRLRPNLLKRGDFRRIRVNGTTTFQSFDEYDRFISGSEYSINVFIKGKQISTSPVNFEAIQVDVPKFRYETHPVAIGGPGPLTVNFTGRGVLDPTSLYTCEITVVNTRVSPYFVNTNA